MFALAAGKARTGKALGNPVLVTEGRVTLVDGILAIAVLAGLVLNAAAGWWWADPLAALVVQPDLTLGAPVRDLVAWTRRVGVDCGR